MYQAYADSHETINVKFTLTDGERLHFENYTIWGNALKVDYPEILILDSKYYYDGISFFTGMQSVKMPVLTTTRKNLWGDEVFNALCTLENWEGDGAYKINKKAYNLINFQKEQSYTSAIPSLTIPPKFYPILTLFIVDIDSSVVNGNILGSGLYNNQNGDTEKVCDKRTWKFTIPKDCSLAFRAYVGSWNEECMNKLQTVLTQSIQVEQGSIATPYEPYKSNILTTPEEVVLREVNGVRDTLNLMTGEYVQRIGEVVLDGTSILALNKWEFGSDCTEFNFNAKGIKGNGVTLSKLAKT